MSPLRRLDEPGGAEAHYARRRMKFLWRLYAGYLAIVLVATVLVAVLVSRWLERDALEDMAGVLRARATLLRELGRPLLEREVAPGDPDLHRRLVRLGEELGTRLTIIRADGAVLGESHDGRDALDNHGRRPEVLEAVAAGAGRATRHSTTVGEEMLYVAVRVDDDAGGALGFARAALPVRAVDARLGHLRLIVVLGAGVATLMALVPGYVIARRISEPIAAMTEVARALAAGLPAPPVPERLAHDELGELARAFETMAGQLRDRMETISSDHNKLVAILGSMVEGVVAIDADERVVHMNEVAARLLAVTGSEALGRRVSEVEAMRDVSPTLLGTLREPKPLVVEVRLPAQPRDQILELHASPLRDAGGAPSGAVVVLHDVTELRRLETLRREFVANVSHELKTPLTAICGLVETMLDDDAMEAATQRRFLEKVQRQADRLATLVRDLLTLSRVEQEESTVERAPLDLREPVLESLRGLALVAEEKGIAVEHAVPAVAVPVVGERETLRQAVDNLLDNAVKYTPVGGRVWLRLRVEGDAAVVEVQDTGIGIDPRDQGRVFERFYRVDKARSRELGGTGLGLSIVKHVALTHGGEVSVDSALDEGSTFRIRLPLGA
ncbi:MAG: PAS domain-containing protein [Planctomycetota bacterium]|nr:PAS domain-containing protein [Planctomycetota bacterium]